MQNYYIMEYNYNPTPTSTVTFFVLSVNTDNILNLI